MGSNCCLVSFLEKRISVDVRLYTVTRFRDGDHLHRRNRQVQIGRMQLRRAVTDGDPDDQPAVLLIIADNFNCYRDEREYLAVYLRPFSRKIGFRSFHKLNNFIINNYIFAPNLCG